MTETQNAKRYDLEDRTFEFAKQVNGYVKCLPRTVPNSEIARQLARSAGSVGANYIEANESLSKKDFGMRIKICRKEAKESLYWLRLSEPEGSMDPHRNALIQEATELTKIFGSIVEKVK